MDKRVQRKLKRNELDNIMNRYPTLNNFLMKATEIKAEDDEDSKNAKLREIVAPVVEDMLKNARMQGVHIGYTSSMITLYKKLETFGTMNELADYIETEIDKHFKELGAKFDIKAPVELNETPVKK